jgi:ATP-dependent Clp protease ATP-binding subunit ClpB
MSEFMLLESVREFRGDESGQTGRLGQVLDQHGCGTLLFDEMEKAHKQIMDLQLQILDAATVTLGNGKRYNLSKFYIVFTTNVGASKVMNARYSIHTTLEKSVLNELARQFRPEFIARFHEKIVFNRLTNDIQVEIAKITLDKELCRLRNENGFVLLYTGDVLSFLIREGIDVRNGARPLRNTIERVIQTAVADSLMHGRIPKGYLKLDAIRNTVFLETDRTKFPGAEDLLADDLLAVGGAAV